MRNEFAPNHSADGGDELIFQAQRIFEEALALEKSSREAFLVQACGRDRRLENLVVGLLAEFEKASEGSLGGAAAEIGGPLARAEFHGNSRFVIERRLGAGAFGDVFQVWDRDQKRPVALKVLSAWNPDALFRFKNEFRALAKVEHLNLIKLYELFSEGGVWFFTMELIDGPDCVTSLRPHTLASEWDRVRDGIGQLIAGVHRLHCANQLHRDLKPSNVLVSSQGRVVVLDFGLIREFGSDVARADMSRGVGTPLYMSPEQVRGEPLTPRSDWFSVGVILFKVLTGRLPYQHTSLELGINPGILAETYLASSPVPIPEDLRALCAGLLRTAPEERLDPSNFFKIQELTDRHQDLFFGREAELGVLETAMTDTRQGRLNVVLVEGPSGIGKSTLVQTFLRRIVRQAPRPLVFSGKCYESESVPYKGIDQLMDELTAYLRRLSDSEVQSLLPRDVSFIPKLFPVFDRVQAISNAPARLLIPDEQELRQRTFTAIREMFARIGDRHPLILWIDDFQWADRDSTTFLAELCSPPQQPELLLVLSYRSEDISTNPTLQYLNSVLSSNNRILGGWRHMEIKVFTEQESQSFASRVAGKTSGPERLARIASESGGHPLFLLLLSEWESKGDQIPLTLNGLLRSRVDSLRPTARLLLETICIAAQPLSQRLAFLALDSANDAKPLDDLLHLLHARLMRTSGAGENKRLEPYHDQIRTTVLNAMSDERCMERHRKLASVLSAQEGVEPQTLVVHYRESGDTRTAYVVALAAAESAEKQLAFDRAATLYESALQMHEAASADELLGELYARLAAALGKAGRGRDSAMAYEQAAQHTQGESSFEMRTLASDQYMRSGYIDEGMRLFEDLACQVGIRVVRSRTEALMRMALIRLATRTRMLFLSTSKITARKLSGTTLARLRLLHIGGVTLAIVDPVIATYFQVCYVNAAIWRGEAQHLAIALALEAGIRAAVGAGPPEKLLTLVEKALNLAESLNDKNVYGFICLCRAYVYYLLMLVNEGIKKSDVAIDFLHSNCAGLAWEMTTAHVLSFWFKCWAGRLTEVRDLLPRLIKEGMARGDVNIQVSLRLLGYVHFAYLASDQPDQCLQDCQIALDKWPSHAFTLQNYGAMFLQVETHLYKGNYNQARSILLSSWSRMIRSSIISWRVLDVMSAFLRGRVALACWLEDKSSKVLHREVESYAKRLRGIAYPWCSPMVAVLYAGIACGNGNNRSACAFLDAAEKGFEEVGLQAFSSATAYRAGTLRSHDGGESAVRNALKFMRSQNVCNPEAFVRMLIPGKWL